MFNKKLKKKLIEIKLSVKMVLGQLLPRKIAHNPNPNPNTKPNPNSNQGAIFLGGNCLETSKKTTLNQEDESSYFWKPVVHNFQTTEREI